MSPAQPGWRVLIATRDDGVVQGPIRLGAYDAAQADRDERELHRVPDAHSEWPAERAAALAHPDMGGCSERWIEYLTPDEVAEEHAIAERRRRTNREIDEIKRSP